LNGDTKRWSNWLAFALVLIAVAMRLLPHPPNFTPVAAIALFSGAIFKKKYFVILPLLAMLFSDLYIGFAEFWVTFSIYLSFVLIYLIGRSLGKHRNYINTFLATVSGSIVFFVLTNFAVWTGTAWYEKTWAGLVSCFWLAIPFFRNTIAGDLFFVALFFGLYELVNYYVLEKSQHLEKIQIRK